MQLSWCALSFGSMRRKAERVVVGAQLCTFHGERRRALSRPYPIKPDLFDWLLPSAAAAARCLVTRAALPLLLLPLAGCLGVRVHAVNQTVVVDHVLDATVEQLLAGMKDRYAALHTLTASIEITATEGSEHTGQVKEIPTFSGYLLLEKPNDLRVVLRVPVVLSSALDMVGDGTNFKVYIPPKSLAYVGSETVKTPSKNGLENLRPAVIRDALLIPPISSEEYVTPTEGSRLLPPSPARPSARQDKQGAVEEPDYDLAIARIEHEHVLGRVRVIHISRVNLLPCQQDIYQGGKIVEKVEYSNYQKVNGLDLPMSILITRPQEEFKIRLDLSKVTLNPELTADSFVVNIPAEGVTIKQM